MHGELIPPGYCQCGCGGQTAPSKISRVARGQAKGQPSKYIRGHHLKRNDPEYEVLPNGCWQWRWVTRYGYGLKHARRADGRVGAQMAHRWYYEREHGPIPDGYQLHHRCENPGCVNPAHLEPLTPLEHSRAHNLRLSDEDVAEIRRLRQQNGTRARVLAERFDVSENYIYSIVSGRART